MFDSVMIGNLLTRRSFHQLESKPRQSSMTKMGSSSDLETRHSLIEKAKNNDSTAWEVVFTLYAPLIKRWARQCGVSCPHDVENVCQDVFAKIVKNLCSFQHRKSGGSFRGWLRVITRNHIFSQLMGNNDFQIVGGSKWQKQINEIPFNSQRSLFDSITDDHPDEKTLIFRRIMAWVDENFSEVQRTVFRRVVLEHSPAREVANDLNLTPNIVYQYKSRILKRIRDAYKELV